jgi:hypothetical protein
VKCTSVLYRSSPFDTSPSHILPFTNAGLTHDGWDLSGLRGC